MSFNVLKNQQAKIMNFCIENNKKPDTFDTRFLLRFAHKKCAIYIDERNNKALYYFFSRCLAYLLRNLSTRPAVSTSFILPVKKG